MNHIYKSVWNTALGAWVAASELACGRGKNARKRVASIKTNAINRSIAKVLVVSLLTSPILALANGDRTWSGGTSIDWRTGNNWDTGSIPDSDSNIFIDKPGKWSAVLSSGSVVGKSLKVGVSQFGQLEVRNGATLTITELKQSSTIGVNVFTNTDPCCNYGSVLITGAGSTWQAQELRVGSSGGNGRLNITNGGTVVSSGSYIGVGTGTTGIVTVSGANSVWQDEQAVIGNKGTGTLNISNGGTVEATQQMSIGRDPGGIGVVNVDGIGSSLKLTHPEINPTLIVGQWSNGQLNITNGASATTDWGIIAESAGSTGTATVSGVGSSWNLEQLVVGNSGTGTLNITNGGTVASVLGVVGAKPSGIGTVTVDGTGSRFTASSFLAVGGYVEAGNGTINIRNGGSVGLSDAPVFIAIKAGSAGTINIGAASGETAVAPGTLNAIRVEFVEGNGALRFNHTDTNYVFAPYVGGNGAIILEAGTTRFATTNLAANEETPGFTGSMNITGGTLWVAATDTLQLTGDYVQTSGGTLRIDVANDTTFGKLVANNVTLPSNAKIDVNVANPNFSFTATSLNNVISADGMLTSDGTFSVTDNSVLFNFGAVKDVDGTVDLTLTPDKSVEQIVVAQGNNPATGAARAIDTIKSSDATGPVASLFVPFTTNEQVNAAVSQTLPLLTGGSQVAASAALTGINRVVQARIESNRGLSSGDAFYGDKKFWMKPFGSWADQDDRKGVSGYKANTSGLSFGADATVSDETRLGLSFAYAKASVDGNSSVAPNSAKVDVYQLISYGSHAFDPDTELNFQLGIGQNKNKGLRQLVAFGTTAVADYNSLTATAGAGLGRTYGIGEATRFTPSIRADYTWIKDKGYTETGAGALNLDVRGRSSDELILAIDGKVAHETGAGTTLTANLGVGYDVLNKQASITAAFAGAPGAAFTTQGIDPSPWVLRGGLGMVKTMQSGMELAARYDAEYRRDFLNQSVSVKLRWAF